MNTYAFRLEGLTPLLMHFDNIEAQDEINSKGRSGGAKGDDRSIPWLWKTYLYTDGKRVVMPMANLQSALISAGKKISIGNRKTLKEAAVSIYFDAPFLDFSFKNGKWKTLDKEHLDAITGTFVEQKTAVADLGFKLLVTPCRIGPARHIRVRPHFEQWAVSGTLQTDLEIDHVQTLFNTCGSVIGIGDWRPSAPKKPGAYGRFSSKVTVE